MNMRILALILCAAMVGAGPASRPTTQPSEQATAEIAEAIKSHRVVLGMSLAQVRKSLGIQGRMVSETSGEENWEFYTNKDEWDINIGDGKVTWYRRTPRG